MAALITGKTTTKGIKRVGELSLNKNIETLGKIDLNKNIERFGELGLNLITGDTTKGIKRVGELALRISRFDSYRLFTLYENVDEKKVMNVSGSQKYYLVFRSPNKEIRIPEYDPKGFFEVDKVNGCILFKITKKNAEDILSMKTGGEKIFHIIRVFEETDPFGKVLSVTDEVEVYHGKWGDDEVFTTFNTENKVDLLTKSLATQVDKNAQQLKAFNELLEKYNDIVKKNGELEEELLKEISEKNSLETQLRDYIGSTYDGTILSTDTKYIAFEDTLENVNFTEDQYEKALKELLEKGEVDFTDYEKADDQDLDEPKMNLNVEIKEQKYDINVDVFKNGEGDDSKLGSAVYGENYSMKNDNIENGTNYIFKYTNDDIQDIIEKLNNNLIPQYKITSVYMKLSFVSLYEDLKNSVTFKTSDGEIYNGTDIPKVKLTKGAYIEAFINMNEDIVGDSDKEIDFIGLIGSLNCIVESETEIVEKL